MSGTDRSKEFLAGPGPVVVLVAPQLGENIGMAARAMANFGLREMRLVAPRDGWPNEKASAASSGALAIVEEAKVYPTLAEALADVTLAFATTARERGQMKRVASPAQAMRETASEIAAGGRAALLFGRERSGLDNDEIAVCDAIMTFPVNPAFASLNIAQAVLLTGYEWFRTSQGEALPFSGEIRSPLAPRAMTLSFFEFLETALDDVDFFVPNKRAIMVRNLRDIFLRRELTEQDVRTLRGVMRAIGERRWRGEGEDPESDD
ncbi:MAG: RNA methyltransferase [Microvirga sp.]|nr:RNA methyltransferase [Microvirga sp.]